MLSQDAKVAVDSAFSSARGNHHEFVTIEHLLLALLDDAEVAQYFGFKLADLRKDLTHYVGTAVPVVPEGDRGRKAQPTLGFQRVLERAVDQVEHDQETDVAQVLDSIRSERNSEAFALLKRHGAA